MQNTDKKDDDRIKIITTVFPIYDFAKNICGDSEALKKLYEFWVPHQLMPYKIYDSVFALIDEKLKSEL